MKEFLKKYKWTIYYWIIILFLMLYFSPLQNKHYLEEDIKNFKNHYLIPALIWGFGILAIGLLIFWLVKTKSIRQSGIRFLSVIMGLAFGIYIFQNIFLGFALFINRQIKREKVTKIYKASFMAGTDQSKNYFIPYDPLTNHISRDRKLINELYHDGLKKNDTIILTLEKGIFGGAFKKHPFNDK